MLALIALLLLITTVYGTEHNSFYNGLLALEGDIYPEAPLWWKAKNAALYSEAARTGDSEALDADNEFTLSVDGGKVLVATSPTISVILAFSVDDDTFQDVTATSQNGDRALAVVPFMQDFLNVSTSPLAIDLFYSFLDEADLTTVVRNISVPQQPSSVLCTAFGNAGLLVPLCALWAASTWPKAGIQAVTFGSPWVADAKFNWAFKQLVDLWYLFPDDLSAYDKDLTEQSLEKSLDIVYKGTLFADGGDIAEELRKLMDNARTLEVRKPEGATEQDFEEAAGSDNSTDRILEGRPYDAYQMNVTIDTCMPILEATCPRVLCKTRLGAFLSAMIYWEFDPDVPDVQGPVPLDRLYPDSVRVKGEYDADAAVWWNDEEQTVFFIFRGSESDQDWTEDYKGIPRDWHFASTGQKALYEDPEVHWGFRDQFEALTSKANDTVNIYKIYQRLSGGKKAKLVWCTGQSLGGGLSTLCGAWAAQVFPHTQVLVVNEGSPRAGDDEFRPYFDALVGRAWRVVNGMDQVPEIPPAIDFEHVSSGLWLPNKHTLLLEERPDVKLSDTNWDDHNYYFYAYYQCLIEQPTVPDWVKYDLLD